MKPGKGWIAASGACLLAVCTLGPAGYVARNRIAEAWWSWRLESADEEIAAQAAWRLCELQPRQAVPRILRRTHAMTGAGTAEWCLEALLRYHSVDGLLDSLRSADPGGRSLAAHTLGAFTEDAQFLLPVLRQAESDTDPDVRSSIVYSIERLEEDSARHPRCNNR